MSRFLVDQCQKMCHFLHTDVVELMVEEALSLKEHAISEGAEEETMHSCRQQVVMHKMVTRRNDVNPTLTEALPVDRAFFINNMILKWVRAVTPHQQCLKLLVLETKQDINAGEWKKRMCHQDHPEDDVEMMDKREMGMKSLVFIVPLENPATIDVLWEDETTEKRKETTVTVKPGEVLVLSHKCCHRTGTPLDFPTKRNLRLHVTTGVLPTDLSPQFLSCHMKQWHILDIKCTKKEFDEVEGLECDGEFCFSKKRAGSKKSAATAKVVKTGSRHSSRLKSGGKGGGAAKGDDKKPAAIDSDATEVEDEDSGSSSEKDNEEKAAEVEDEDSDSSSEKDDKEEDEEEEDVVEETKERRRSGRHHGKKQ